MAGASAQSTWTAGAPKWAAVIALGAASTTAIGWAIGRGGDSWRTPIRASAQAPAHGAAAPAPIQQPPVTPPAALSWAPAPTSAPPAEPPRAAGALRKLINVNTAGQGELELLPGIGPALAKRIIEHRAAKGPFRRVDDLDAVKGIGPKILERLRPQVTVE